MDDNLFNDNPVNDAGNQNPQPTEQKFTIGDKEYTQDQLNDLVTKGNQLNDIEARFNTKIDKVVPDYTRASQEAAELRKWKQEREQQDLDARAAQGNLSQEELIRKAKMEAQTIGLMTDENTPQLIRTEIERVRLDDAVDVEIDNLKEMGIDANPAVIKRYMASMDADESGRVSLDEAISQIYGPQIKIYQEAELNKAKPEGMYSEGNSNAGGYRLPPDTKVTDDNIGALLTEAINS